jgi:ABC-type amino acid transport system, permease component
MNLDYKFMISDFPIVLRALPVTLALTLWSMLFAVAVAVLFGAIILRNVPILKQIVIATNSFLKGIPLIVQLLFCYYAIPYLLSNLDGFLFIKFDPRNVPYFGAAVTAFAFNFGAYMTDVVVSSVKAVDKGQLEACYSVGMTKFQGMMKIVIPQAAVISIPNMANYFIWLLKATSIASVVNVVEMLTTARISASDGYQYMEAYLVAAAIYWIVCIVMERLIKRLDVRVGNYNKKLTVA